MYRKTLLIILSLITSILSVAQPYYFRHYDKEDGLSHLRIRSIVQDELGFVWVGTGIGLNRFNGRSISNFYKEPDTNASMQSSRIRCIVNGKDGKLWISTEEGLCSYDIHSGTFRQMKKKGTGEDFDIMLMCGGNDYNIWAKCNDGLYCINTKEKTYTVYPNSKFVVSDMTITRSGILWLTTYDGKLYRHNEKNNDFTCFRFTENENIGNTIFNVRECDNGNLLISGNGFGARLFNPGNGKTEHLFDKFPDYNEDIIHSELSVGNDEYWFGTENGIYIYKKGVGFKEHLVKSFSEANTISDNAVHHLFKDSEGGIWVGTFFGGINYLPNVNEFKSIFPENSEGKSSIVRDIVQLSDGTLAVGSEDNGICWYNPASDKFANNAVPQWNGVDMASNIQSIMNANDEVWLGTMFNGIYVLNRDKAIIRHIDTKSNPELGSNSIITMGILKSGNYIICTSMGCYIYNKDENFFHSIKGLEGKYAHSFTEYRKGAILIATHGQGLFEASIKNDEYKAKELPFPSKLLNTIFEDSKCNIWIGTATEGLYLYDLESGSAVHRIKSLGRYDLAVMKIIEDQKGRLWITTSNGLYCYDITTESVARYGTNKGMATDQFNYNSGIMADNGEIYAGTLKGMISFNPMNLPARQDSIPIYIISLKTKEYEKEGKNAEKEYTNTLFGNNAVTLEHDENTFSITLASPTYSLSQSLWYRYKLEGASDEWHIVEGSQQINFAMLPPGHYTLKIQVSTDNTDWDTGLKEISVTIKRPLWMSPLAILAYILIASALAYIITRSVKRRKDERERVKKEKEDNEKYKEVLQSKINFFTAITHEIRTPLTLIMGSIERLKKTINKTKEDTDNISTLQRNSNRLLDLVNQLLDFRKIESSLFLMNFTVFDVRDIVINLYNDFTPAAKQKGASYNISTADTPCYVTADKEALVKIISNILSNATKFCEKNVSIDIKTNNSKEGSKVDIMVMNDGPTIPEDEASKIFRPFYQYYGNKSNTTIKGSGLGLSLALSLAEMHNGKLTYKVVEGKNCFQLELPLTSMAESAEKAETEAVEPADNEIQMESESTETENPASPKKEKILIVDDEEELRNFIREELQEQYDVIEATNGKEAIDMIAKNDISLVITDIMMPIMNGIELCQSLKSDINYSHLPIIVLTAKVSLNDHIEALNSKADAYIEKPFSTAQLHAQIANLLANRELVRAKYLKSPYAQVESVASNPLDEKFIKKLNDIIAEKMNDTNLSVDTLAEAMNMSNSTLYRKVKAVTSLSPNDFIKICRLKKSAQLLSSKEYRIKEVSTMTGFSSVAYFTSCFMKQFGITPGEFLKKDKKQE